MFDVERTDLLGASVGSYQEMSFPNKSALYFIRPVAKNTEFI
jgi:hypothetical protein